MSKPTLVFHLGHSAGFYSEFNNMVLAILYCQRHDIDFRLYSADANFRVKQGWRDFFLPFCPETSNPAHHYINHRFSVPTGGKRKLLYNAYKQLYPTTFLTSELWESFRHIDQTELSTIDTRDLSAPIINNIYRFNPSTQQQVDNLIQSIDLPGEYVGFHVRGGDKTTEHDLLAIDEYVTKAETLTSIRDAFVYTDDYRLFSSLQKKYTSWHFHTLTPKEDRGYFFDEFMSLSPNERAIKTVNMFASMELLSRASLAFCTFSSNVGMFLGMRMGDRAIGIDMEHWMIW